MTHCPLYTLRASLLLGLALAISLQACGIGDLPCQPTASDADCAMGEARVQEIMDTHCATCHGESPVGGAPGGFRLDIYQGRTPEERATLEMQSRVLARSLDRTMPPAGLTPLSSEEIAALEAWSNCQCNAQIAAEQN